LVIYQFDYDSCDSNLISLLLESVRVCLFP